MKISYKEEKYFNWRGKEVSRTENLSDIVFAMALTLVVASSVPTSFAEIAALWREGIAIALCFIMLLSIWYGHYLFFRRYDLEDRKTMFLNAVLIFLVMVFAYPLKFLANFLVNFFTGGFANDRAVEAVLTFEQAPWLTAIYSMGYALVFFVFCLLYRHANKRADDIGLSEPEKIMTKAIIQGNITHVLFGLAVTVLALLLPAKWDLLAGMAFVFIGFPLSYIGNKAAKKANKVSEVAS